MKIQNWILQDEFAHKYQKLHLCETSGKCFSMLEKHILFSVHEGIKQHKCDTCGETFGFKRFILKGI